MSAQWVIVGLLPRRLRDGDLRYRLGLVLMKQNKLDVCWKNHADRTEFCFRMAPAGQRKFSAEFLPAIPHSAATSRKSMKGGKIAADALVDVRGRLL